MKSLVLTAALLLASTLAHGKTVDGIDCNNAMSQMEMNICAGDSSDAADIKLNKAYKQLKELIGKDRPALQSLVKSERAWITYRDIQCEAESAGSEGGSIHSMELSGCVEEKTIARTKELKRMIVSRENR
jgi:uncharacterized protein YecT (DUF1311 family)